MPNYTTNSEKIENLVQEVLSLPRSERGNLILKLFSEHSRYDNKILIAMLRERGVTAREIAKNLGINESVINRKFSLKSKEESK